MHIVVITHAQDQLFRRVADRRIVSDYMLGPILGQLAEKGHRITVCQGFAQRPERADFALLHVDLTVVPPDYLAFAAAVMPCLNIKVADISKRAVSGALLRDSPGWGGPVIAKSDLNFQGLREGGSGFGYEIFDSPRALPAGIADDPALVVERFLPERTDEGYAVRFWTFAGDAERCSRVFSREPIVKAHNQTGFEFVPVPEPLRAVRAALGFDYGKFDFVMHEGVPVLIDANKTPGAPPVPKGATWPQDYAEGLLRLGAAA